jgi:hypothetical protein
VKRNKLEVHASNFPSLCFVAGILLRSSIAHTLPGSQKHADFQL